MGITGKRWPQTPSVPPTFSSALAEPSPAGLAFSLPAPADTHCSHLPSGKPWSFCHPLPAGQPQAHSPTQILLSQQQGCLTPVQLQPSSPWQGSAKAERWERAKGAPRLAQPADGQGLHSHRANALARWGRPAGREGTPAL